MALSQIERESGKALTERYQATPVLGVLDI